MRRATGSSPTAATTGCGWRRRPRARWRSTAVATFLSQASRALSDGPVVSRQLSGATPWQLPGSLALGGCMTSGTGAPVGPPAGWYPDPAGQPVLRWWDGVRWGEQTQAAAPPVGMPQMIPVAATWAEAPAAPRTSGNGYSTAGIILGAIAFLFIPIICGPAGLILGGVAMSKGESRAVVALIVSGVGMIVGFILGALVWSSGLV